MSPEWYKSFGNDATRCIITGSPKHDTLFHKQNSIVESAKVYSSLGLDPDKKTILHLLDFLRNYPMLAPSFFMRHLIPLLIFMKSIWLLI